MQFESGWRLKGIQRKLSTDQPRLEAPNEDRLIRSLVGLVVGAIRDLLRLAGEIADVDSSGVNAARGTGTLAPSPEWRQMDCDWPAA